MKKNSGFAFIPILLLAVGSMSAKATPTIANGSFEANTGCSPAGWSYTNCFAGYGAVPNFGAADGNNALLMGATDNGGVDVLSQTIGGFTPGSSYTLTFAMAPEAGANNGRPGAFMLMNLTGASVASQVFSAFNPNPNGCCWMPWITQSLTFTATSTSVSLSMHGDVSQSLSWEFLLDNFQVMENSVPEPGTLGLLGAALVPLVLRRRRHSRRYSVVPAAFATCASSSPTFSAPRAPLKNAFSPTAEIAASVMPLCVIGPSHFGS